MQCLIDNNLSGQLDLLAGALFATGWPNLIDLRLVTFAEVHLPEDVDDRSL